MKKVLLTLVFVSCYLATIAQWIDNPAENNRITPTDMNYYDTDFKVTPDGITYILINRPTGGNIATCIQIMDRDGKMMFPEEGKIISQERTRSWTVINDLMMIDKDNNAIIAVHDCRNSPDEYKKVSYSLYKVSPTGELLWGDKGVDLNRGHSYDTQAAIRMVQLEDGSFVFAWMIKNGDVMNIQLQRLSNDGDFIWDNNIELQDNTTEYAYPYLTNAGNNQVNLVYAKGSNQDIMVRKIDFDGSSVWPEDVRVYRGGFGSVPLHVIINVFPDPNGGVFIGWYDDREFINKESSFISYVKPNGTLGFPSGEQGEKIGYSDLRSFRPELVYDKSENCVYALWRETSANQGYQRIMAQKIGMTGELKWGPEGIELAPLSNYSAGYYTLQDATDGQATAFFMLKHNPGYGNVQAYAIRFDKDGNFVWGAEPLILASNDSEKSSLISSPLINNNYWLTMWNDERKYTTDPDEDISGTLYMQKVNLNGTLGGTTAISSTKSDIFSLAAIPSVIEESTIFIINNKESGLVDLSIYSVSGQKVAVVCHQEMDKGINEINWNSKTENLTSGVYIATLNTATSTKSIRIIIK